PSQGRKFGWWIATLRPAIGRLLAEDPHDDHVNGLAIDQCRSAKYPFAAKARLLVSVDRAIVGCEHIELDAAQLELVEREPNQQPHSLRPVPMVPLSAIADADLKLRSTVASVDVEQLTGSDHPSFGGEPDREDPRVIAGANRFEPCGVGLFG